MRPLRAWFLRWGGMFDRERRDRELDDEIESSIEAHVELNLRCGMSPEQARRLALVKFGGVEAAKESYRDRRGFPFLEHLAYDLRHAAAAAARHRGFTAVVVFTLALGIGASALVFSAGHALFLRPLPYRDAEQLAIVEKRTLPDAGAGFFSHNGLQELREQALLFEGVAGCQFNAWPGVLRSGDNVELTSVVGMTGDFLPVLGVRPYLGSDFASGEQASVLLSHRLWRSVFQARPDIIGRQVQLDGSSRTVAGVMPAGFQLFRSERPEVFVPSSAARHPEVENLEAVVRLRRGAGRSRAEQELAKLGAGGRVRPVYRIVGLRSRLFGDYRPGLATLAGAVIFVLLIACANVMNLLFARMTARAQELRVRVALGASRFRVAAQLLIESLVMSLLGGAVGLMLAFWGLAWLGKLRIGGSRGLPPFVVDLPVIGFVALLCLFLPLICALAPAWRFCTAASTARLKEGAASLAPSHWRSGRAMVVIGMAFSFTLLVGAGLLVSSFLRVARVDPGFKTGNLLFMDFDDNHLFYADLERRQAFYDSLVRSLQALPGLVAAGVTDQVPLSDDVLTVSVPVALAQPPSPSSASLSVLLRSVDSGFFRALNIPVKSGRWFTERDAARSPCPAIISESFARRIWPGADPSGQRLKLHGRELVVVGVAGDIRELGLRTRPAQQVLYVPAGQFMKGNRVLVVRAAGDPLAAVSAIKLAARSLEPGVPAVRARSMAGVLADSTASERFSALLMSGLGALALLLASVGVYALVSFSVSQRKHEFAMRTALGAQPRQVLGLLFREGSPLIALAVLLGAAGGWVLSRLLAGQLYGVSPNDPTFFAGAGIVLAAFASLACYLPARQASKADPMSALRCD